MDERAGEVARQFHRRLEGGGIMEGRRVEERVRAHVGAVQAFVAPAHRLPAQARVAPCADKAAEVHFAVRRCASGIEEAAIAGNAPRLDRGGASQGLGFARPGAGEACGTGHEAARGP